jgi:isocitrate lyase
MNITGGALDIFRNINQYTVQIATKRNIVSDTCVDFYVTTNVNIAVRFAFGWVGVNAQVVVRRLDADTAVVITAPINDTAPHLIQVTLNNSNYTVYLYIDGVLVNSAQLASSGSLDNTACGQVNVGYYNITNVYGKSNINGISINTAYSDSATIQAQYRGYLQRGFL